MSKSSKISIQVGVNIKYLLIFANFHIRLKLF